jgi:hypothetical protein
MMKFVQVSLVAMLLAACETQSDVRVPHVSVEDHSQDACTGAAGEWLCAARKRPAASSAETPVTPPTWGVPFWAIDRQNSIGCASDANTGTSATCVGGCSGSVCLGGTGPLLTCQELEVHRWGTTSPILQQNTVVMGVSSWSASDTDRCYPNPRVQSDSQLIYQGTLATVQTGTLGTVTAKSSAVPGNMLQVVLGAGLVAGEMVTNTNLAHASVAQLFSLVSGTTWNVSQPCVPQIATAGKAAACVEVNSWTTGDGYTVSTQSAIAFGQLSAIIGGNTASTLAGGVSVYHVDMIGSSVSEILLVQNASIYESAVGRSLQRGASSFATPIVNSDVTGNILSGSSSIFLLDAGQFRGGSSAQLTGALDLRNDVAVDGVANMSASSVFNSVFLDGLNGTGGGVINLTCGGLASCNCSATNCVYGPGVLDATRLSRVGFSGGSATGAFTCGGVASGANCLRANGGTTANVLVPSATANTMITCGPFPLTPSNMDTTQTTTCSNTGLKGSTVGTAAFGVGINGALITSNTN